MAHSLTSLTRGRFRRPLRLEALEDRTVPNSVVPNSAARRGVVFDDATNLLYFTTTAGEIDSKVQEMWKPKPTTPPPPFGGLGLRKPGM